jgi:hypothetical protein
MPFDPKWGCIPPICVHILYDKTGANAVYKKNGVVVPANTAPALVAAAVAGNVPGITGLAAYLKSLTNFKTDCGDGCSCEHPPANRWPWVPMADYELYNDQKTWVVTVTGINVKMIVGPCVPATTVKKGAQKGDDKENKKAEKKAVKKSSKSVKKTTKAAIKSTGKTAVKAPKVKPKATSAKVVRKKTSR